MKNPAAVAYEAYRTHLNTFCNRGGFLIGWEWLPEEEKRAWFAAVGAVVGDMRAAPDDKPPVDGRTRRRSRRRA